MVSTGGAFRGFRAAEERVFLGAPLLLRRRTHLERYGLWERTSSGERRLAACAIHFRAVSPNLAPPSALGGLLFSPTLRSEQVRDFGRQVLDAVGSVDLAPYNGHLNLGLSHPATDVTEDQITFLCAGPNRQMEMLLEESGLFSRRRELRAYETEVTPALIEQTRQSLAECESRGLLSRPLSLLRLHREIGILNRLVNQAMAGQPNFYPLTPEEDWDVWKLAWPMLEPSWFRFLMVDGREAGFCFAIPDYNTVLRNSWSDARNALALASARTRGSYRRGRLVYSGVDPAFRGRGLFKTVRHRVISEMIASGVREFESSYIDEGNAASAGNVSSTGGRYSHRFFLYGSMRSGSDSHS
ncbi:MAG: hypothetical protein NDI61_02805 [Bdellovibrionaceae bacterium]|nr:hypothetical protein [Pseudobdellovibrionaceae bacterium]